MHRREAIRCAIIFIYKQIYKIEFATDLGVARIAAYSTPIRSAAMPFGTNVAPVEPQ
jgi:hypothetical protein